MDNIKPDSQKRPVNTETKRDVDLTKLEAIFDTELLKEEMYSTVKNPRTRLKDLLIILHNYDIITESHFDQNLSISELEKELQRMEAYIKELYNLEVQLMHEGTEYSDKGRALFKTFMESLFTAKTLIINRISELKVEAIVTREASSDSNSLMVLQMRIESIIEENRNWRNRFIRNEEEKRALQETLDKNDKEIALRREEREALKEKWAIWRSFLERESVSTIVGALLLVIITITLIIATFTNITTSQIIDNGFLVLLGYFFGQTVAKASQRKEDD